MSGNSKKTKSKGKNKTKRYDPNTMTLKEVLQLKDPAVAREWDRIQRQKNSQFAAIMNDAAIRLRLIARRNATRTRNAASHSPPISSVYPGSKYIICEFSVCCKYTQFCKIENWHYIELDDPSRGNTKYVAISLLTQSGTETKENNNNMLQDTSINNNNNNNNNNMNTNVELNLHGNDDTSL